MHDSDCKAAAGDGSRGSGLAAPGVWGRDPEVDAGAEVDDAFAFGRRRSALFRPIAFGILEKKLFNVMMFSRIFEWFAKR